MGKNKCFTNDKKPWNYTNLNVTQDTNHKIAK